MAIEASHPAERCVCSHSAEVHGLHNDPGCSFCSCKRFQRPAEEKVEIQLGKYPGEALALLGQDATLRSMPKEALVDFVKDGHGRMYAPGAYMVHRGDRSQHLFVVLQGNVIIENKDGERGKQYGVGTIAGDIGALTDEDRHASVYAADNVLALEIDAGKMRHSFAAHPDLFMALVTMLGKFSNSTDDVIAMTVQAAIEQQQVEQQEERDRHEGLDPDKALEIAARWRKLKEEEKAAADRAREAAQKAIQSQTQRR